MLYCTLPPPHTHSNDIAVDTPLLHLALGVFNVHTLFVKFLSGAGFDSTLVLDFVMSPETHFSHFLLGYLKIVIREKENEVVFNYDLQSACAELDIVDEYMSMDLSGSEDGENGTENSDVALVEKKLVDSHLPNTSLQHILNCASTEQTDGENKHSNTDASTVVKSSFDATFFRKRDSSNSDELPSAKRTAACVSLTASGLKPSVQQDPMYHPVPAPQPVTVSAASQPSQNIYRKEPSHSPQRNSPSEGDDPPPTVTFVRVLKCLVELGDTLSRLCDKELLSKRVNNVERIVCLTGQLKRIFSNVY